MKLWLAAFVAFLACVPAHAAAPQRVASVFLCTDEYVFRLLPRSRIAALSYLAADRHPVVSTIVDEVAGIPLLAMSAEAVLAARPDLVVLAEGTSTGVRSVLRAAGIPFIDVPWATSLDEIRAVTRSLSQALGVSQRGEALIAEMDARLAAARVAAPAPPVKAVLYEPNGYTVAGGLSDAIMNVAGIANIAPDMRPTRQGTVPVETIIVSAPELLILNGEPGLVDSRARQMLHHPALARLAPGTHQEWLSLTPLLCPGPWSAGAAETLAGAARRARGLAVSPPSN